MKLHPKLHPRRRRRFGRFPSECVISRRASDVERVENTGNTIVLALGDRGSRVQISPLRPFLPSILNDLPGHPVALPFLNNGTKRGQSAVRVTKSPEKIPNKSERRKRCSLRVPCSKEAARHLSWHQQAQISTQLSSWGT